MILVAFGLRRVLGLAETPFTLLVVLQFCAGVVLV